MSIDSINKNILSLRIIENINSNLGIDNNSLSSKTRLLADSLSEEINTISILLNEVMTRFSTSTANGAYLDLNGAEYGVYRNYSPYLITDTDNVAHISPLSDTDGFNDIIVGKQIINAGELMEIDGVYLITFLSPVVIESKFVPVQTSIRIEPISTTSSVKISKNTKFQLSNNDNPYLDYILLKISADISTPFIATNDDDFRIAIQKAKALKDVSSVESIAAILSLIKSVNGYTISNVNNSAGTIKIRIVTDDMVYFGTDNRFQSIAAFIRGRLSNIIVGGIHVDIGMPEKVNLKLRFKKNNSFVPSAVIKEAIAEFIKINYQYTGQQIFNIETITKMLISQYKSLKDIEITEVGIFDAILNEQIIGYSNNVELDALSYITISSDDIEEV